MTDRVNPSEIPNLGRPRPGEPGWRHGLWAQLHRIWAIEAQLAHHHALKAAERIHADVQAEKPPKRDGRNRLEAKLTGFRRIPQSAPEKETLKSTSCNTPAASMSSATSTATLDRLSMLLRFWAMKTAPVSGDIPWAVKRSSSEI